MKTMFKAPSVIVLKEMGILKAKTEIVDMFAMIDRTVGADLSEGSRQ